MMGRIVIFEFKKLFQWKMLIILILLIFVLNIAVLYSKVEHDYSMTDSNNISYQLTQDDIKISYEEFLNNIEQQAIDMLDSTIFKGSSYNKANLEKTAKVYNKLHGIRVLDEYKDGIKYVTDYRITDILLLLAMMGVITHIMLYERGAGFLPMIKSSRYGRGRLIFAKYIVMITCIFFLTILFFGINYLIACGLNLMDIGDASIQSLKNYIASPYAISINQYIVLFFIIKLLALIAVGSVIFFICICCRNQTYTIILTTAVMGVEMFFFYNIENYSWLSPLKQMNLIAAMDTSSYFNDYINFNLFGIAVPSIIGGVVFMIVISSISILLSVKVFNNESSLDIRLTRIIKYKVSFCRFKIFYANLLVSESKKLLFMHRGILLIIILVLVQIVSYYEMPLYMDKTESYYKKYSLKLAGNLSDEKDEYLKQEKVRFSNMEKELKKQYERYENGEIKQAVLTYYEDELTPSFAETEGFERARKQYEYLKEKENKYEEIAYIYETGWDKLLGNEGKKYDLIDFMKLILVLILAFAGAGTCEKQTGVELLINSSYSGKKKVSLSKHIVGILYIVCATIITFTFRICKLTSYYNLSGLNYNIQSISLFSGTELDMSIGIFLFFTYAIKLIVAIIAGITVLRLSEKFNQEYIVLLLSSIIFLVPMIVIYFC